MTNPPLSAGAERALRPARLPRGVSSAPSSQSLLAPSVSFSVQPAGRAKGREGLPRKGPLLLAPRAPPKASCPQFPKGRQEEGCLLPPLPSSVHSASLKLQCWALSPEGMDLGDADERLPLEGDRLLPYHPHVGPRAWKRPGARGGKRWGEKGLSRPHPGQGAGAGLRGGAESVNSTPTCTARGTGPARSP